MSMGPAIIIPLTRYQVILFQTSKLGYYAFYNNLLKLTQEAVFKFLWITHRQRSLISSAEELPLSYHDVSITKFNRYRNQKNKTFKLGEKSSKPNQLLKKLPKMYNKNWEISDVNQRPVVRKLINGNIRLKVNQGLFLSR